MGAERGAGVAEAGELAVGMGKLADGAANATVGGVGNAGGGNGEAVGLGTMGCNDAAASLCCSMRGKEAKELKLRFTCSMSSPFQWDCC